MNWEVEIKKWLPGSRVCVLPGRREEADQIIEEVILPKKFDIIVTSYEGMTSNINILRRFTFKIAVIDEAHKMKNRFSIFGQEAKRLKKEHAILLTGTPLMNNLSEVWSLLNFIMPHLYTDPELFVDYLDEEEKRSAFSKDELVSIIHKCLQPLVLRRLKADTDLGLPPKKEILIKIPLSKFEREIYRKILLKVDQFTGRNTLMEVRKLCVHPYCISGIEEDGLPEFGDHIIQKSSKLKVLDKMLEKMKGKHKVLIFSQFKIMLNILEDYCVYRKHNFRRIDGDYEIEDRQNSIEEF